MDRWGRLRNKTVRIEARRKIIEAVRLEKIAESELDEDEKTKKQEARLDFLTNFHCHIKGCQEYSCRPAVHKIKDPDSGEVFEYADWNDPGDLHRCRFCGKLTCENHLRDGTCNKCIKSFG